MLPAQKRKAFCNNMNDNKGGKVIVSISEVLSDKLTSCQPVEHGALFSLLLLTQLARSLCDRHIHLLMNLATLLKEATLVDRACTTFGCTSLTRHWTCRLTQVCSFLEPCGRKKAGSLKGLQTVKVSQ